MTKRTVYFDNSSTTQPFEAVIEHMGEVMRRVYGNPSSLHHMGVEAEQVIKEAREDLAKVIEAKPTEIIFTSGGTESNNLALKGAARSYQSKGKHIITSEIEHSSVLNSLKQLEQEGFEVTYLPVDRYGFVDVSQLQQSLRKDTILVSIMHVNNETGTIQPLDAISDVLIRNSSKPLLHVDAVQSFGFLPLKLFNSDIDLLTISSHKSHGPKGLGALFIQEGVRLKPLIHGGNQQSGIRSGTENVAGIAGFSRAISEVFHERENKVKYIEGLKHEMIQSIKHNIPDVRFNTPEKFSAPHILNITFPGVTAEVLLRKLEAEGIYVSTSSACNSRNKGTSHVLKAMMLNDEDIEGALRFSFSRLNSREDVVYCMEKLVPAYEKLKKYSTG